MNRQHPATTSSPLTRRALEALLANGLITALEDDNVVQRAVDTLMSDLDGG